MFLHFPKFFVFSLAFPLSLADKLLVNFLRHVLPTSLRIKTTALMMRRKIYRYIYEKDYT